MRLDKRNSSSIRFDRSFSLTPKLTWLNEVTQKQDTSRATEKTKRLGDNVMLPPARLIGFCETRKNREPRLANSALKPNLQSSLFTLRFNSRRTRVTRRLRTVD